jgi:nicotinamidase-related amidase
MKPAIIIIDMVQDFFRDGRLLEHKDTLVKNINALTKNGRSHSIPVVWVRQEFRSDLSDAFLGIRKGLSRTVTVQGTDGAKLLPGLHVEPSDEEIVKKRYSAFFKTGLDELLEKLEVNTLIIGGVNTHACVRMAVVDAYQRDYDVLLATNCTGSYDEEHHRVSFKYLTGVMSQSKTNEELFKLIGNFG